MFSIADSSLVVAGKPIFTGLHAGAEVDETGFLSFSLASPVSRAVVSLGQVAGLERFTYLHRYEPFWMRALAGTDLGEVLTEVQFFLAQLEGGQYLLVAPLPEGLARCALQGSKSVGLELVAESNDTTTTFDTILGAYIGLGDDPYELMATSAWRISERLQTGKLRVEKTVPAFVDSFGWCTWDAFYSDVSEAKVREGLESFREGGVEPKLLILDDGWLSVKSIDEKTNRLVSFDANEKFPGGLAPMVETAKGEYGVETVLAWHAMTGYWGGVDPSLEGYGVEIKERTLSEGLQAHIGEMNWWGTHIGLVPPEHSYRFFQDFHRQLRKQGIDGVKVDVQAQLETVSEGTGGRVNLMQRYHEALEGSVQTHFNGNLINCMSCASEMLYGALASTITRTSTDFWPDRPESHGLHLYVNAQVSAWFGEFVLPDWDMFQSAHAAGPFHAAGRAISGGPVYVSDKPDAHNFELLNQLVLPDGTVLRAMLPGRPTRDCLFHNPTEEDVLLKIFSRNYSGGVIGAFNARYTPEGTPTQIEGHIKPSDVEGIEGQEFVAYAFDRRELRVLARNEEWPIQLGELGYEIFTIAPIEDGCAALGLADKMNGGAAVLTTEVTEYDWTVFLTYGGAFVGYSQRPVESVESYGMPVQFSWDEETGLLLALVPTEPNVEICITFAS